MHARAVPAPYVLNGPLNRQIGDELLGLLGKLFQPCHEEVVWTIKLVGTLLNQSQVVFDIRYIVLHRLREILGLVE